jgi:hypothetical protein
MDAQPDKKLLPMTILDGMILVAGCAVSAWLLADEGRNSYIHPFQPQGRMDWVILTAFPQYGPTIVGPFVIGLQFWRGRRQRLMPGESAWLVIGVELLPFLFFCWAGSGSRRWLPQWWANLERLYMNGWLFYGSPPLVIVCALAAWAWHFRGGQPRHWSHQFGLWISLAQCVPSTLIMFGWF